MELVAAFLIGWVAGARGGERSYRDVAQAVADLRRSEEFHALVDVMRNHLSSLLRSLADVLADREEEITAEGVVDRVLRLMGGDATSSEL